MWALNYLKRPGIIMRLKGTHSTIVFFLSVKNGSRKTSPSAAYLN